MYTTVPTDILDLLQSFNVKNESNFKVYIRASMMRKIPY